MNIENLRAKSLTYDSWIMSGDQFEGLNQLNVSQVICLEQQTPKCSCFRH